MLKSPFHQSARVLLRECQIYCTPVFCKTWSIDSACARNYRPCFRENQPKRSFSSKWIRAFRACFRENWVYKFGHCYLCTLYSWFYSVRMTQWTPESIATLPPFGPIEGHKWFDQISSHWESPKNRFVLIYFGKIQFLPPCFWNLPFMSYRLRVGMGIGYPRVPVLHAMNNLSDPWRVQVLLTSKGGHGTHIFFVRPQIANVQILGPISQFQSHKFLRCASMQVRKSVMINLQITNPQISLVSPSPTVTIM